MNVAAIDSPINIEPLREITHSKSLIRLLHSQLNPHLLYPRTVSKGMQYSFQIPLVDGTPILFYYSPFCKTILYTHAVVHTPLKEGFNSRQGLRFPNPTCINGRSRISIHGN